MFGLTAIAGTQLLAPRDGGVPEEVVDEGPTTLLVEDWSGDLSAYRQFDSSPGSCAIAGDTLLVDSGAGDGGGSAYIDRSFSESTTGILSLTCSLTFVEWAIADGGGFTFLFLMDALETTVLGLAYTGGVGYYVTIYKLDGSGNADSTPVTIPDGAVVELAYDRSGAQPIGSLYVNGELGATVTDTSTANPANVAALSAWGATSLSSYGGRAAVTIGPVTVADGYQGV